MSAHLAFPALNVTRVVAEIEPACGVGAGHTCKRDIRYPCICVYVVSMSYKDTFSASLTDIRQFMTKDTLVALQVPLEVHLQMFSKERSFQTSMAASTHFRWFSSKHSSTLTSLLQLSPHLGQACLKSGYPAPV